MNNGEIISLTVIFIIGVFIGLILKNKLEELKHDNNKRFKEQGS